MINNLHVLGKMETFLKNELDYIDNNVEKKLKKREKQLVLQKNTPWGKLINPKTKIGHFFDIGGEVVAVGGLVTDLGAALSLVFGSIMLGASSYINDQALINTAQEWCKNVFSFAKYPFLATLPFIGISQLKQSISSRFYEDEIELKRHKKIVKERKENLIKASKLLENLQESNDSLLSEFIQNVDLSQNSLLYNKELIILLACVSNNNDYKNLKLLANYLRSSVPNEVSTSPYTASMNFLQNDMVKQLSKIH